MELRRGFMGAATGLAAGLAVPRQDLTAQPSQGLDIRRISRLFEPPSPRSFVVNLIQLSDRVLTLFQDNDKQQFGAAAFSLDGNRLWQYQLPPAFAYSAIGTGDGGRTVLVRALNVRLPEKMIASALLGLDPQTGASEIVHDFGLSRSRSL